MLRSFAEHCRLYLGLSYLGLICLVWGAVTVALHPLLPARLGQPLGRRVIATAFHSYLVFLRLIGACRFDLSELDTLRHERQGLILAPNHPSLLDAVMVISKFPNVACIMKSSLMDNLFLGGGARLARYIRNEPLLRMIKQSVHELRAGSFVLIFPEGTRTVRAPVNECRSSIGLIAARAGAPVQTLLIEADSQFLSKGWPLFRCPKFPVTYRVRLGKRFAPPLNSAQFNSELERYFQHELDSTVPQQPLAPFGTPLNTPASTSATAETPALEFRERAPYA